MIIKDFLTGKSIPVLVMTLKEVIEDVRKKIKDGYEMSWFTTDVYSYEWSEINDDVEKFLKEISKMSLKEISVGYFNQETKWTIYETYKVIG